MARAKPFAIKAAPSERSSKVIKTSPAALPKKLADPQVVLTVQNLTTRHNDIIVKYTASDDIAAVPEQVITGLANELKVAQKKCEQYKHGDQASELELMIDAIKDVVQIHKAVREHLKKRASSTLAIVLQAVRKSKVFNESNANNKPPPTLSPE